MSSVIIHVQPNDTVRDLIKTIADTLDVGDPLSFSLYEMRSPLGNARRDALHAAEHSLADHMDELVGEMLAHWQHVYDNSNTTKIKGETKHDTPERWLLYKASLFMPPHKLNCRGTTLNLLYLQAFFDVINGRYNVDLNMSLILASFLIQGHHGDFTADKGAELFPMDDVDGEITVSSTRQLRADEDRLSTRVHR
jgi:hypothetical protein